MVFLMGSPEAENLSTLVRVSNLTQMVRYGAVGLISTAINYTAFILGITAGWHYLVAATGAAIITALAGYVLHRGFTFRVPRPANPREFASFACVFALQYVLGMLGYVLTIGLLGISPTLAFIVVSGFVAVAAFTALKYGTFR